MQGSTVDILFPLGFGLSLVLNHISIGWIQASSPTEMIQLSGGLDISLDDVRSESRKGNVIIAPANNTQGDVCMTWIYSPGDFDLIINQ